MNRLAILFLLALATANAANAEPMQELQASTTFPSLLDLSGGNPARWGEREQASGSSAPLSSGASQGSYSSGAPRTQLVSGYTRKNGTYVAPYVRSARRR